MNLLFLQRHYQSQKCWVKIVKDRQKSYKNIGTYNIGYITIKKIDDYENIYSVNPLYLRINHASGYIKEKGVNKYLIFDPTDENKELLKTQWRLDWNRKQNQRNKYWQVWLWKKLHEN